MVSLKILKDLSDLESKLRKQTNDNILIQHGLTEEINKYQQPVVEEVKKISSILVQKPRENNNNILSLRKKFQEIFNFEIDGNFPVLSETVKPKIRFEDGQQLLIINKQIQPMRKDGDKIIFSYNGEEFEMTKNLASLLLGDVLANYENNINDLKNYQTILQNSKLTNKTPRFKELNDMLKSGQGLAVPVDLTDKNPIDLFIELKKLEVAKKAGNNNTLGRASIILDHLNKLKCITKEQYLNYLKRFTH